MMDFHGLDADVARAYIGTHVVDAGDRGAASQTPVIAVPKLGESAAPDVPVGIAIYVALAYVSLMLSLVIVFAHGGKTAFVLAICTFFLGMYLLVPTAFLRIGSRGGDRPSLARFRRTGMDTMSGRISSSAALSQILGVPVLLTFGVLAFGLIRALVF